MLAWVAGHIEPARFAAAGRNDADPAESVLLADLGILDGLDAGIEAVGVVHQREIRNAASVQLPVGDRFAVRAQAESVAKAELFLIDPVERAVDFIGVSSN